MAADLYCIDASSLIKLKQDFRRNVFSTLWDKVEELVQAGGLIAPDEVFREMEKDDILGPWARKNKKMFKKLDQKQIDAAKEIASHFPNLAKPGRFGPAADPFVVALARLEDQELSNSLVSSTFRCVVVTEERGPDKVPGACKRYNLNLRRPR